VMNKADVEMEPIELQALLHEYPGSQAVSALKGTGIDALRQRIREAMIGHLKEISILCPWSDGKTLALIRSNSRVLQESAGDEYCEMRVLVNEPTLNKIMRIPGIKIDMHDAE